jgi:hypothetical protein
MINTLWTFGDSFTYGSGCLDDNPFTIKYKKSEEDKIWPELVASKLNLKLENIGMGLFSNDKIIDSIIDNYNYINENDLVIIGNTFYSRFDIPYEGKLITLSTVNLPDDDNKLLNDIIVIMDDELLKNRQLKRISFIKSLLEKNGTKCVIWEVEPKWNLYETIAIKTNNEIYDHHWSYKGHRDFSNYILNKIKTKTNKLI